ncbi:hypothetical protein FLP10_06925 [Agromyces intestinalis]|uniref:Polysaccharide chain length determinant N-terminal domain-containing protein n=1 Tax=Agromyces intestinalis TaxID=2592652 RepID=A0A5C1YHE6_9MICO|nr:Wzz/FepE/Etk N-terminal domain-containing protein [Agromyces intestinalis]QEO14182.1 hypothetical protein FLP10_06925 [Agromyces intestinalis]
MELRESLRVVRRNWAVIAVIVLVGTVGGLAATWIIPEAWESKTTVAFEAVQSGGSMQDELQANNLIAQQLPTYAQLALTSEVLQPVIEELGLDVPSYELAKDLTVEPSATGGALITITAGADTGEEAAALAGAIADELISAVSTTVTGPDGQSGGITGRVVDPAFVPDVRAVPILWLDLVIGFGAGLVIAFTVVAVREVLNRRIRGPRDLDRADLPPLIGTVPRQRRLAPADLVGLAETPALADAFQRLRIAIGASARAASEAQRPDASRAAPDASPATRVIVVVAVEPRAGATTVAAGLATAAADSGQRVALVDADLRAPAIGALETEPVEGGGLAGFLDGTGSAAGLATEVAPGLRLVRTAPAAEGGSEALGSTRMAAALDALARDADLIVIDGGAVTAVADPLLLAPFADAYLVVARAGSSTVDELAAATRAVLSAGATVAGVVLNRVPARGPDAAA